LSNFDRRTPKAAFTLRDGIFNVGYILKLQMQHRTTTNDTQVLNVFKLYADDIQNGGE